ncbi:ABC transporter ATP-binding protein [Tistrella bauzanensis]|uniref:ABC transporter ATP-binding protein n=1 Tax=Tistrella bauzanensis TaxID=657419 RepID=A0ABQ1J4S6_9PROT|nr:ABC transporter substrate-binding protein [Tistrella bauzanensis]GGB58809.1 ABC transporter ATP-binding protein [Tistrella bauzanensis]
MTRSLMRRGLSPRRLAAAALIAATTAFSPTGASAADKLVLLLDWFVNPDHAPLLVAQEQGYFTEEGLDVEMIAPADPSDPPKMVAAKRADLAVTYQPQLIAMVHEGLPLKRVSTLVATPLNSLIVLKDGPIQTLADLKGRRIGYSIGGFEDVLLGRMLASAGLTTDDVTLINVNFALSPSVMSGQVDAVIGAYRNVELVQMDLEGRPGRAFLVEEHGIPPYDELVIAAHADNAADPRFAAFNRALEKGVQFLVNHPEASWELYIRGRPEVADEGNRRSFFQTISRFAHSPAALDHGRWRRFATFMADAGLIDAPRPVEDYAQDWR